MKQRTKYILGVGGVISTILGISLAIPSFAENEYTQATIASILVVTGIILIAISFGE